MFGKDKVKAHNRVSKGKSGYKVIRVDDFLRKKDNQRYRLEGDKKDNAVKSAVLGVGAIGALGVGATLLLKKKGIKFPGQAANKKPLLTNKESPIKVITETIGTEPKNPIRSGKDFIAQMDEEWGIGKKKINKNSQFPKIEDPWETPILTKIQKESSLVTATTDSPKLLAPAKKSTLGDKELKKRGSLFLPRKNTRDIEERVMQVSNAQRDYKSLPVEMQAILQIEKSLRAPTQVSRLGRPPETTSIIQLVDKAQDGKLDKVVRKTKDRLVREKTIADDVASRRDIELKKN